MTYDKTTKKKILQYATKHGHRVAIKKFQISSATLYVWFKQAEPDYVKPERKPFFHKLNPEEVKNFVQQHPDSTLAQIGLKYGASEVAVYNCLKKLGFSFKKRNFSTNERDEQKRAEYQEKIKDIASSRLVYLDESGLVSELQQDKCRSEIGRPVVAERSGQRKKRVNLFCGLNSKFEAIPPFLTEENYKSENFEDWFEKLFLESVGLVTNAVIIMDNARFHRKAVLFDCIKHFNTSFDTQFSIIFLSPYSPDFNPIEK